MATDSKQKVLEAIRRLSSETGQPPTLREVAKVVHLANSVVSFHVKSLAQDGLIIYDLGSRKGIVVPDIQKDWVKMPLRRYMDLVHLEAKLEDAKRTVAKMREEKRQHEMESGD